MADGSDNETVDFMDIYQSRQIGRAHRAVDQVAQEAQFQRQAARDEVAALHDRIDRLVLLNEAIWQLLAEALEMTDDQLDRRVVKLDGDDGTADGRRTRGPIRCQCGAMVNARVGQCQFCGEAAPVRSSFDAI